MIVLGQNGVFNESRTDESARVEPGLRRLSELLPAVLAQHGITTLAIQTSEPSGRAPIGDWQSGNDGSPANTGVGEFLSVG
jgi:hypothetical protein